MPCYRYDLHVHSCLSPCGDDEMTPPNIVNMAALSGLDILAITDHNSARNAGAVMRAAELLGLPLTVIPGLELNTSEEVHMVCLFPDLASAEAAGEFVESRLLRVINDPAIFGRQVIMDEHERETGSVEHLLINATDISYDDAPAVMARFGGICYPAHIDKNFCSVLMNFGFLPPEPFFPTVEVYDPEKFFLDRANWQFEREHRIISSSDAHTLDALCRVPHTLNLSSPDFAALKTKLLTGRGAGYPIERGKGG